MLVYKCDICQKIIEENRIMVIFEWNDFYFCHECGKEIGKFLNKHKLLKEK